MQCLALGTRLPKCSSVCIGLSAAICNQTIGNRPDILKHNTPFAVGLCIFPDASGALFVQNKSGLGPQLALGLGLVLAAAYRPLVSRVSSISYVLNADSGLFW